MKSLASDNYAGAIPEAIQALLEANKEHAPAYGNDSYTSDTENLIRELLGVPCQVRFVFNGTGANLVSMSAAVDVFNSILCADISHMMVDESTGPEMLTNSRLLPIPTNNEGKIILEEVKKKIIRKGDEHHPQPRILSITQPTEYGTVYGMDEIKALSDLVHGHNMYLHMDGARICNAMASLGCDLRQMTVDTGVDIFSFGGTKLGLIFGEAVVIINDDLKTNIKFKHKRSLQLSSKTRFIACQFHALLKDNVWRKYASHANEMAKLLSTGLGKIPEIQITKPVNANAVFAILPFQWIKPLQDILPFYVWDESSNEVRLMCSFDTTHDEINSFVNAAELLSN